MTIIAAMNDTAEGAEALTAAADEARQFETDLVVVNLGLTRIDVSGVDPSIDVVAVDRAGSSDRDPAETVLREIDEHDTTRLVIGIKRRSAVGKALLGSVSQHLLLNSPVPVLAVKTD